MKNNKFKVFTLVGVSVISLGLGGCSSSGEIDAHENGVDSITEENEHSSSANASLEKKIVLAEKRAEEFLNVVYNEDFDAFIGLLDKINYEIYEDTDDEGRNEYREKFLLINEELKKIYGENWIGSIEFDKVSLSHASHNLYNMDTYIEGEYVFELKLEQEDGEFVLQNGLDDLDDLRYIY